MKQRVNVDDPPKPGDEEEPIRFNNIILSLKLSWCNVIFLKDFLVKSDVSIPRRGTYKKLN